ncbi:MAG TPA: hypothetical protein PKY96_16250 [Flavobacteriales bacterium]|nr:hypothetical protein [Flavobacteriales bacterium]
MECSLRAPFVLLLALSLLHSKAQSNGDYRSAGTGNWTVADTWERFNGTDFVAAGIAPSASDGVITIRTGHTVSINSTTTADQIVVEAGATLSMPSTLNLSDGAGPDLVVNGTLLLNAGTLQGTGLTQVNAGGTFTWNQGTIGSTMVMDLLAGSTATLNGTGGTLNAGTINNAGTFTMLGGTIQQIGSPAAFNNLPTGVVDLNGWASNTGTWVQNVLNQGTINKNNGATPFAFVFPVNNTGTINVPEGELFFNTTGTSQNSGTIAFGSAATLLRMSGTLQHTSGGSITGLDHLLLQGGTFTLNAGSTIPALPLISFTVLAVLDCLAPLTTDSLVMINGDLRGAGGLTVNNGFNWNGGTINSTAILNLPATCTTTLAQGGNFIANSGIINNAGTFNMVSGTLGQLTAPARFNNLPGGVLDLNGWANPTSSWVQNIFNQGTINKNNGTVQFDLAFTMTNEAAGTLNVNSGTLRFSSTATLRGTVNVPAGSAIIGTANGVVAEGLTVLNNGSITPLITFQGTAPHFLNGTGNLGNVTMNGAGLVTLGGTQTMSGTLSFTTGVLELGDNDLVLTNATVGSVSGGSASSHVRTSGTGTLSRAVNGNNYVFPVGTSSYTPLTMNLTTGPQEQFAVRVQNGISTNYGAPGVANGAPITARAVGRTWVVAEQVSGGNTVDLTVQWNATDELPLFNRSLCAVSRYDGTDWVTDTYAAAVGNGPFTRTLNGVSSFREFSVSDNLLNLNTAMEDGDARSASAPRIFPQPADNVLHLAAAEGRMITGARLLDASGRVAAQHTHSAADRVALDVGGLPPGVYVVEWMEQNSGTGRAPVLVAR